MVAGTQVSGPDRDILRSLGQRVAEIAADPIMADRRAGWKRLNGLKSDRPMILVETGGVLDEVVPLDTLQCRGGWSRGIERWLRNQIFYYESVGDDMVIEPSIGWGWQTQSSDYGVEVVSHKGDDGHGHGSIKWDAPISNIAEGLEKLRFRTFSVDRQASLQEKALLEEVFDGVLQVPNHSWFWWTQGLTGTAIKLIGLEGLMMAMFDQPDDLHRLMAFLRDDQAKMLDWFEQQGLLSPNNQDHYVCSGGRGYTDELPQDDYVPGQPGRVKDMWGLSESQETVGVSPAMFAEFIFPYQLPLISRFGLSGYGCCEPIDKRFEIIKQIPNLRRVSVSPWANQTDMAQKLARDYIYSRKPNPTLISMSDFDEELIRKDLRETLQCTKGLNVEIVMKDVHFLAGHPDRLGRWTGIAREIIDEIYGS
ncbi:MAG: hypothetical protein JW936_01730 [Sedimentisphaerales bacterium]|nr:hypothetical protein [Sedimentisphaerales bacterium]